MGRIGRWISGKINTFIVGVVESRFGYNVTSNLYGPSGDDSPPLPDDRIALMKKDGAGNWVAVGVLVLSQGAEAGEKILYSRDSAGVVKATFKMLKDGVIELNGNADFAVAFDDLKTQFDELQTAFNTHTHIYIPGTLATVPTATPLPQSAADIDQAKVAEVKLP